MELRILGNFSHLTDNSFEELVVAVKIGQIENSSLGHEVVAWHRTSANYSGFTSRHEADKDFDVLLRGFPRK